MRATPITVTCLILLASAFAKAPCAKAHFQIAKQQILDLEQIWVAAEHNRDVATLRRILDDKFVASFDADKPLDKGAFIKSTVTGEIDPTESQNLTDRDVIIDRDTPDVVGTDAEQGTKKGKAYTAVCPIYCDLHSPQWPMGRVGRAHGRSTEGKVASRTATVGGASAVRILRLCHFSSGRGFRAPPGW